MTDTTLWAIVATLSYIPSGRQIYLLCRPTPQVLIVTSLTNRVLYKLGNFLFQCQFFFFLNACGNEAKALANAKAFHMKLPLFGFLFRQFLYLSKQLHFFHCLSFSLPGVGWSGGIHLHMCTWCCYNTWTEWGPLTKVLSEWYNSKSFRKICVNLILKKKKLKLESLKHYFVLQRLYIIG